MSRTATNSDSQLVAAARAGDKAALSLLVERHRPPLLSVCRRMTGDRLAAEDAAQEAILRAIVHLDRLRRPERFGQWLAGIGLNVCRVALRTRSADAWSLEAISGGRAGLEPADRGPGPEERLAAKTVGSKVKTAVATLPPGQRAAVLLYYLEGLNYREAAAQLDISTTAVKTRLHNARATMARRLWSLWKEEEMARETERVRVRVIDVRRRKREGEAELYALLLEEESGGRRLPIWVGAAEGSFIAMQLEDVQAARPLTLVFTSQLLKACRARLRECIIARLAETTFYATAVVESPAGVQEIDARPSDVIGLAMLTGAPIFVMPQVFAESQADIQRRREAGEDIEAEAQPLDDAKAIVADVRARWAEQYSPRPPLTS